jgi:hypothetical protein
VCLEKQENALKITGNMRNNLVLKKPHRKLCALKCALKRAKTVDLGVK